MLAPIIKTAGKYTATLTHKEQFQLVFEIYEREGDEQEVVAVGTMDNDGCSNWDMAPSGFKLHFCEKKDLVDLNTVLLACYDYAKECDTFDVD